MQIPNQLSEPNKRVVIAMSGGVDSSVAAALLVQQGYDVVGVMMRLWSEPSTTDLPVANRCCTPDQMDDARRVANHLDIPFFVLDTQSQFRSIIVQQFIDEHKAGQTPNPCIACNRQIRFSYLLQHAQALGAQYLATGHYARVRNNDGIFELLKGLDPGKDQSYVLYVLNQAKLAQVLFPVGSLRKENVRLIASELGLPVAHKHDSQDLCFISDGDYRGFLKRQEENGFASGPILDLNGKEVGRHTGLPFYTIGQRKGLGVNSNKPLYVLHKDQQMNAIVVGPRSSLERDSFTVRDINWIAGKAVAEDRVVEIKIRYKSSAVPGHVKWDENGRVMVNLLKPATGVTPGQGAVFYDGDICLGGGIITHDSHRTPGLYDFLKRIPEEH